MEYIAYNRRGAVLSLNISGPDKGALEKCRQSLGINSLASINNGNWELLIEHCDEAARNFLFNEGLHDIPEFNALVTKADTYAAARDVARKVRFDKIMGNTTPEVDEEKSPRGPGAS